MGRKYTINVEIPNRYNWRTYYKEDLENALDIIGRKIVEGGTEGIIEFDIKWNVQEIETSEEKESAMKEKKIAEGVEVWVTEKVTYYGVIDVEYDGDFLTDDDVRNAVQKIDEEQKEFFEPVDGEHFGLVEYRDKNVGSGDLS